MRPFYAHPAFARHYDRIILRPNAARLAFIGDAFASRGVTPPARLLDAGCGTGDFCIGLAQRGYHVTGIDLSVELLQVAHSKRAKLAAPAQLDLQIANILAVPGAGFAGVLCRGVLNDLLDEHDRRAAIQSFGSALRPDGVLILDTREWDLSRARKRQDPVFCTVVQIDQGELTFTSRTEIDENKHRLISHETHLLTRDGKLVAEAHYDFTMQCWTMDELHRYLSDAGFAEVACYGDFDQTKPVGSTDRIILIATKSRPGPHEGRHEDRHAPMHTP
jgi:SAM-dependent methyltransferase